MMFTLPDELLMHTSVVELGSPPLQLDPSVQSLLTDPFHVSQTA
jgi:hypothetical protein